MRTQQEDSILGVGKQASRVVSTQLAEQLGSFVEPLLVQLDIIIDKRLVRTLLATLGAIIQFRNRSHGLLLSELGGYLMSADQAPAGTKRLSNLLRCAKWHYSLIEQFLWGQAQQKVAQLREEGVDTLALWDESVLEKSESIEAEGLCSVRSSKAARLKRIKPGYFNPPGGRPIFVPGMHWLSVLLVGTSEQSGPPAVAKMQWWTERGEHAQDKRTHQEQILRKCAMEWGGHYWEDTTGRIFLGGLLSGGLNIQFQAWYDVPLGEMWPGANQYESRLHSDRRPTTDH